MELVEVMDGFGIDRVDEVESNTYIARYHPGRPRDVVAFPKEVELPRSMIVGVCEQIRRIARTAGRSE